MNRALLNGEQRIEEISGKIQMRGDGLTLDCLLSE